MRKRATLTAAMAVLLACALVPAAESAERFEVDRSHSHIGFAVKHFGISTVRGQFTDFTAELMIDEDDPARSSVVVNIEAKSIDTDNGQRDDHLRSDDFFNVEAYPSLIFQSRNIERTGDGEFMVTGDLTIRETTREVSMPATLAGPVTARGTLRVGIEGELTIDRQDYGVKFSRLMEAGGLVVGNDVKISFTIEAARPLEEAPGS